MRASWFDLSTYFPLHDDFDQVGLFFNGDNIWEVLLKIGDYTNQLIIKARKHTTPEIIDGVDTFKSRKHPGEVFINVRKLIEIERLTVLDSINIVFEAGVVLEPGAIIKAPAYIGVGTHILHGAYLRGNVITGKSCVLGHCTEVKNSVIMNHSAAAHFAYIGDSIIGSYVNIGAGTRLANLQFRTGEDKVKKSLPSMKLVFNQERVAVDQSKIGAFIGDYSETGCNAVLSPGVFLGANCWVYANVTVKKGYYPPGTIIHD